MEVTKEQISTTYAVEFKGEDYSVTITDYINLGYTDTYVYDSQGEVVEGDLASEIISLIEAIVE